MLDGTLYPNACPPGNQPIPLPVSHYAELTISEVYASSISHSYCACGAYDAAKLSGPNAIVVVGIECQPCPFSFFDTDEDGFRNPNDNCPDIANPDQLDSDGDGTGDICDTCPYDANNDIDSDGVCGDIDNCPQDSNPDQIDTDSDSLGNVCDTCPYVANPDQSDKDNDGLGDACDDDADGDGFTKNVDCNDLDKNINPKACDIKKDGIDQDCDGVDRRKGKPCAAGKKLKELACADGIDNDNDGLVDCADPDCSRIKYCR